MPTYKATDSHVETLGVTTTNGERFTGEETVLLAALINKRFGYDKEQAAAAWRRMLGNSCPDEDFAELASFGRHHVTYQTYHSTRRRG